METGHRVNSTTTLTQKMKIIAREPKDQHRKITEAILIHTKKATLNRNDGTELPDIYLPILREEEARRGDHN